MAVNLTAKIIELLKMAGIDYSRIAGKIDPNKIKHLVTKTQKTATKPKLIDALNKEKATFSDALKIFEDEAQYISQMNEMELANFANNLDDYFKVGGKKKNIESNVVTTEGTPIEGTKLTKLAERKGSKENLDKDTLEGSMQGLMSLVDELKGISPKMRNQMDRNELAKFIQKMRGKKFTNDEVKIVREYMDKWGIGLAKEKGAPAMQYAKKLGAKNKEEFEFIEEYLDNIQSYSPNEFRETFDIKKINMDINTAIENKLEKHFKKKYKWDKTKTDGGLDDINYNKYEDELYQSQKEFGEFHTMYDTNERPNIFGIRTGKSWVNHPNNYLDEASVKLEEITGEGLNVDFYKSYTEDALSKYPKLEKFQYGGMVFKGPDLGSTAHGSDELTSRQRFLQPGGQQTTSTGLNYLLGEDDTNRIPFRYGKTAKKSKKKDFSNFRNIFLDMPPEMVFREPVNFPYKSLEDIPPKVLAMLKKDPNFDLETFLTKVGWSDSDKTRIQERLKGDDEAWGLYSPRADMSFLNYQKFGESEPIADGLLSIKSPTDEDKVQTILHEMRHGKMKEPWFRASSAVPKYVRDTEHPDYSFQKYDDREDPNKFVGGEELYVRFMDQHFGDVAEKGSLAGSDYKPYFDKILKDLWDPYAENYKNIIKEEKRVKSKPYGLAGGGIAGMLGEPAYEDEEHRVPYQDGELVQGETYMPPKKFYGIGLGPLLDKFMSEGRPRDKEGFHTTLNKNDLINLLNYLKEDQDINLEDELMFRFGRFDPEKNSQLHIGIGKDQKEIGFKKKIDFNKLLMGKANGGRIGFKNGKGPKMSRRTFLKGLGALAALPVFGKFFKFAKPGAKVADLTSVPIKNAEGMPAWFKPLVNRVIKEGDDVTKQFAWKERQIIHSKKLGEEQGVKVYQDLDNQTISVEYQSADNMGGIDDSVNLEYKAAEEIATKKGSVKTKSTFEANEAYPYQNPKDYKDVTFQDINAVNKVDDLFSDTSALKQFGTNKDLPKKELEIAKQKRKRVKKINESPAEELGPLDESPYDPIDYGEYANGGVAGMLGE